MGTHTHVDELLTVAVRADDVGIGYLTGIESVGVCGSYSFDDLAFVRLVCEYLERLIGSGSVIPPRRTSEWRSPDPVPVWAGVRIDQVLRELRG